MNTLKAPSRARIAAPGELGYKIKEQKVLGPERELTLHFSVDLGEPRLLIGRHVALPTASGREIFGIVSDLRYVGTSHGRDFSVAWGWLVVRLLTGNAELPLDKQEGENGPLFRVVSELEYIASATY